MQLIYWRLNQDWSHPIVAKAVPDPRVLLITLEVSYLTKNLSILPTCCSHFHLNVFRHVWWLLHMFPCFPALGRNSPLPPSLFCMRRNTLPVSSPIPWPCIDLTSTPRTIPLVSFPHIPRPDIHSHLYMLIVILLCSGGYCCVLILDS